MKTFLGLAMALAFLSGLAPAQWTLASVVGDDPDYIRATDSQSFWRRVSIGHATIPRYYTNLQAALVIGQYSPSWPNPTIKGLGVLQVNPAVLLYADLNLQTRFSYRTNNEDRWMVWTKLPPIPNALIGHALAYQIVVWEKTGPPNYSLVDGGAARLVVAPG